MEWKKLLNPNRPEGTSQTVPDHREQFERDYDRTVFSAPVRRLQDKTQVFPLDPNDSVRTRLTHSLEVSTLARGLARSVAIRLENDRKIDEKMGRQIEAIAATCGLLHDLGNPPFGHAGEDAIREWFSKQSANDLSLKELPRESQYVQDMLLFQGNAQTIRLITKLQILSNYGGLNLTFGTLSAALKYVSASHEVKKREGHAFSKLGYFASENNIVARIREETGTGIYRNPITFLVEAADDLAYSVVDIEDGISKGILTWDMLVDQLEKKLGKDNPLLRAAIEGTYKVLRIKNAEAERNDYPDQSFGRAFRTSVINIAVPAVTETFMREHDRLLSGEYYGEIAFDSSAKDLLKACKKIGVEFVYSTYDNLKLELMGRGVIHDLLEFFWEGVRVYGEKNVDRFPRKISELLSDNYKKVFERERKNRPEVPIEYLRLQLVIDYVCGMTDSFALNLRRDLQHG